jgi:hypothetical protein
LADAAVGAGEGVWGTLTGRTDPVIALPAFPARGPGEPWPLGAGLGFEPAARAIAAPCVGLGDGTPGAFDGARLGRTGGATPALGAAVARATGTGEAVGCGDTVAAGAGERGVTVGGAVGCGGTGDGRAVGTRVGTAVGAAVGGIFTLTATTGALGTLVGTAGSAFCGVAS